MLEGRAIDKKMQELSDKFHQYVKNKQWSSAKYCYDVARNVAVFLEFDEDKMHEIFGERAEHGVIISEGMFPETMVVKTIAKCTVNRQPNNAAQKNSA